MTVSSIQVQVRIDAPLQAGIQRMKDSHYQNQVRLYGTAKAKKLSHQRLISGKLVQIHREIGFDEFIETESDFPLIFSPPTAQDKKSIRMAFRIKDPEVYAALERTAEETARPLAHIIYTIVRKMVENESLLNASETEAVSVVSAV
ncbi:MAG: hypothetical protein ABJO36_04730 [Litorimonas sp.]